MHAYILNGNLNLILHFISKQLEKSAKFYALVWPSLSKVENNSKSPESLYAWLSLKWEPKFSFKFQLRESQKNNISYTFS